MVGLMASTPASRAEAVRTDHLEIELIAEHGALVAGERGWLALRLRHAPQWHTYWRNPGDAGAPTQITWNLPPGYVASAIEWPTPERLPVPPLANYGYSRDVLLLVPLGVPATASGDAVALRAHVDWLVCKDVCIPGSADLSLDLPLVQGSVTPDPRWIDAFARARNELPQRVEGLVASARADERVIRLNVQCPGCTAGPLSSAYFFPVVEGLIEPARPQIMSTSVDRIELQLPVAVDLRVPTAPVEGVLVTDPPLTRNGAGVIVTFALEGVPRAGAPSMAPTEALRPPLLSLATLLAFALALAGGIVLNLMPCVFPVLSLKILGFVNEAHGDAREARANGAAFAVGIVTSFVALGLAVVGLRETGSSLGWGFQLQSPWAVTSLAGLFLVLAMNLLGVFEVTTPSIGSGHRPTRGEQRSARTSAFLSGTLAAVVASPCTAPFMGAALGYALVQDTAGALGIFAAIGLGMALPYVLLTRSPALLRSLPRPGPWLAWLRRALALPLLGTVAWLLWVLEQQTDAGTVGVVLGALALLGLATVVHGRVQFRDSRAWELCALAIAAAGIGLGWYALAQHPGASMSESAARGVGAADASARDAAASNAWLPWSPEAVEAALARGESVFVDFTAAWCITCQVNKKLVLERSDVQARFASRNVRLLRADWTRRDQRISDALAALSRNGVPVYALYRPGQAPIVLPEVLTRGAIDEALGALASP